MAVTMALAVTLTCGHTVSAATPDEPAADARQVSFSIPSKDSPEMAWWRQSMTDHDARMEWWREARFGMFVHWGVYSGLGGTEVRG